VTATDDTTPPAWWEAERDGVVVPPGWVLTHDGRYMYRLGDRPPDPAAASTAPGADLVEMADEQMRLVLSGQRVNRVVVDAAMAVLRRVPVVPPAKGRKDGGGGALHVHVTADGEVSEAEVLAADAEYRAGA
jgi:hypothetical protein